MEVKRPQRCFCGCRETFGRSYRVGLLWSQVIYCGNYECDRAVKEIGFTEAQAKRRAIRAWDREVSK